MKALTLHSVNRSGEEQDIRPNHRLEKSEARVDALQFGMPYLCRQAWSVNK